MSNYAYEKYGEKTYRRITEAPLTRKPFRGEDVLDEFDFGYQPKEVQEAISKFPIVVLDETWIDGFYSDKLDGNQQFYILISSDFEEVFICDTQGYDYARYVAFLTNLPEDFFEEEAKESHPQISSDEFLRHIEKLHKDNQTQIAKEKVA